MIKHFLALFPDEDRGSVVRGTTVTSLGRDTDEVIVYIIKLGLQLGR